MNNPRCKLCDRPCQTSNYVGFFACMNVSCIKYMLLQYEDYELWEMITKGIDMNGKLKIKNR